MNLINQINFGNNFMRPINPLFIPKGMFYIPKQNLEKNARYHEYKM